MLWPQGEHSQETKQSLYAALPKLEYFMQSIIIADDTLACHATRAEAILSASDGDRRGKEPSFREPMGYLWQSPPQVPLIESS